jgi:hypothetical protein
MEREEEGCYVYRTMEALVEISQNVIIPFTTTCDL